MEDIAAHGHVLVVLEDENVVFLREVRSGSVNYIAPGVSTEAGETPGQAAARAAREVLGIEVEISELVFADTELGSEHFYFLATPLTMPEEDWDAPPPSSDGVSVTKVPRSAMRAYPVRPTGVAHRLHSPAPGGSG
jgi:ADP-ribose pyrophosphatase YjhB (NUDIX family)